MRRAAGVIVAMGLTARRAFASYWFLAGFAASSRQVHGESLDVERHPALRALLLDEFARLWAARGRIRA